MFIDNMTVQAFCLLTATIFMIAVLYSSVGHGGASGYIAALALFSIAPAAFKPTALLLNILVASVASWSYARAGHFNWRLFWPFAAASIPCSFIGGYLSLPSHLYKPLLGLMLFISAARLLSHGSEKGRSATPPKTSIALVIGAVLGLLSGLTGVGGGIFLSPVLLLMGWGKVREVSAVAALFILVNSVAGIIGHLSSMSAVPSFAPVLAVAAVVGGAIGSFFGSRLLPATGVVRFLALVLVIAGSKLLLV